MKFIEQIQQFQPSCDQEKQDQCLMLDLIEQYKDKLLYRASQAAHMTSSGFIMNEDLSKVLVIHHKLYDAWGWTGGHSDGEEDLLATALKEAREETGLETLCPLSYEMMSLDILPVWGHRKKGAYVSAHLHLNSAYVLIAREEDPLIQNEEETNGVMWIEADAIGDYSDETVLVEVYKKLIERARSYRVKD